MDADAATLGAHLRDEAAYADAFLSRLTPDARALAARAAAWFPAAEATVPERMGAFRYWTEQRPGEPGPRLLRLPADAPLHARPTLVLDAAAVLDDLGAAGDLGAVKLSPCGRWVAALADADGEPAASVRAIADGGGGGPGAEVARIPGALGIEWGGAGTGSLFYTACPAGDGLPSEVRVAAGVVAAGAPPSGASLGQQAARPAAAAAADPVLLAWSDPRSHLALSRTKDGAWLVATAVRRDAAASAVLRLGGGGGGGRGGHGSPFTAVGQSADGVETFVEGDGRGGLVLLTNDRAAGQGGDAAPPEEAWLGWAPGPGTPPRAWSPLVRRRAGVIITDLDVYAGPSTADAVLLYERNIECGRPGLSLTRLAWEAAGGGGCSATTTTTTTTTTPPTATVPAPVRLPSTGAWAVIRPGANADPLATSARISGASPLAFPRAWDVCLNTGRVSALAVPPETGAAAAAISTAAAGLRLRRTTVLSEADSHGAPPARVPLIVIEPKQQQRPQDRAGPQPPPPPPPAALLPLYGAYGLPLDPDFDPLWLSLALEGWTVVLAGVRGGGERGRAWHAAGRGAARQAAVADAAAAAAWASAGGTRPVVVSAHSAGGLLAGHLLANGAVAGAVLRAPFLDVCTHALGGGGGGATGSADRTRQDALAAAEAGEWAFPGDAAGLAAACPYARLKAGPPPPSAPPILITVGDRDDRVALAGVSKWVARWRAARSGSLPSPSPSPTLLRVRPDEGHDGPAGSDALDLMGLEAAFALAAVGGSL
jgi:hypothetical protein